MNTNTFTVESFINWCDDMMIDMTPATESFQDIKERIISALQALWDKIRLFLAKITKNKEVTVNKDFFNEYQNAKSCIDNAYSEHCDQEAQGHISTFFTDRTLDSANGLIQKISEMPAKVVDGEVGNTIKLYDIYTSMIKSQQHVKTLMSWIKQIKDPDDFEKLDNQMLLKIESQYLRFYTTVYNKICKL